MDWYISGGVCSLCTWPKQMECFGVHVGNIQSSVMRKDQGKARQGKARIEVAYAESSLLQKCGAYRFISCWDQSIHLFSELGDETERYLKSLLYWCICCVVVRCSRRYRRCRWQLSRRACCFTVASLNRFYRLPSSSTTSSTCATFQTSSRSLSTSLLYKCNHCTSCGLYKITRRR